MLLPSTLSRAIAGAAVAGTVSLALAPPASAAASAAAEPVSTKGCATAPARVARMVERNHDLEARLDRLQKEEDAARQAHHDRRADRIEHRIETVKARRDGLADRLNRLRERCGLGKGGAAPTPPTSPSPAH